MADTIAVQRLLIGATGVMLASVIAFGQPPNGGGPGPVLGEKLLSKLIHLS